MSGVPADLPRLLDRARGRAVLIVGDLMLDHFVIGRVERISPEAPVPVVQFDHEEYRLGGAANVAHNVAVLGVACPRLQFHRSMAPGPGADFGQHYHSEQSRQRKPGETVLSSWQDNKRSQQRP